MTRDELTYNELAAHALDRIQQYCLGRNLNPDHLNRLTVARLMVEFWEERRAEAQ